jgi:hypothetical protein
LLIIIRVNYILLLKYTLLSSIKVKSVPCVSLTQLVEHYIIYADNQNLNPDHSIFSP